MPIYKVDFLIPGETFAETDAPRYSHSVLANDASHAFNLVFQRVADASERDYPDPATRPIMTLRITNCGTDREELPDPIKIQAALMRPMEYVNPGEPRS